MRILSVGFGAGNQVLVEVPGAGVAKGTIWDIPCLLHVLRRASYISIVAAWGSLDDVSAVAGAPEGVRSGELKKPVQKFTRKEALWLFENVD